MQRKTKYGGGKTKRQQANTSLHVVERGGFGPTADDLVQLFDPLLEELPVVVERVAVACYRNTRPDTSTKNNDKIITPVTEKCKRVFFFFLNVRTYCFSWVCGGRPGSPRGTGAPSPRLSS
jgi:hypothetical protein